jgi:hypothetical protein
MASSETAVPGDIISSRQNRKTEGLITMFTKARLYSFFLKD